MAVIGIDLGTTNSLAAYWKDGKAHLIPNGEGEFLLPSVVSYVEEQKKMIVGSLAKQRLLSSAAYTKASFKRFMGTEKKFYLGERSYSALELSAMVLEKIKIQAELYLGEPIEEAVVTVPAYFNDKQRSDTKKAAQLAGLCVNRLINEPSAAALSYRMEYQKEDMSLLVFDFGGGTLDLSLVECFDNVVEIVAVAGDNHLGGDDIDLCIAQWFCEQKQWNYQEMNIEKQQLLLKKSEKAKMELNNKKEAVISMDMESATLTEEKLFEICMPLFSRIKTLFLRVLKDGGFSISGIDDLIMVGGSSKLSVVRAFLTELLGKSPVVLGEPDCVVAMGAGVYAGIRERKADIRDMMLTDVCPFTLGVGTVHGADDNKEHLSPVIERNSTLPARGSIILRTVCDYQSAMNISIYQGEEYYAKDNIHLADISVKMSPKPAGQALVEVYFMYDLNGILQVEAVNDKGERKKILISNKDLTEEEVQAGLEKMQQMLLSDEKQLQIQMQLERIMGYYEQAVGIQREQISSLIGWYMHEIDSGKQYRQKYAMDMMEQNLASLEELDENLDEYLFDGELKFDEAEEDEEW